VCEEWRNGRCLTPQHSNTPTLQHSNTPLLQPSNIQKMKISVTVNGEKKQFIIQPSDILLDVLRREGYTGVKQGCGTGDCGACTVIVNGKAVNSCMMMAAQADGAEITTIEGLSKSGQLHPLQQAFIDHGAAQCGFCIPGMILSAKALLDENPQPTEAEVQENILGNLCRCTGYKKQVEAIMAVVKDFDLYG
jgi:carbon-monoxide dehydrogenase small subunit